MASRQPRRPARNKPQGQNGSAVAQAQPSRVGLKRTETLALSFSGPLPPPNLLAQYNDVAPNGADRIIAMAEKQSAHRMGLESHVVKRETIMSYLGLGAAVTVALTFLGAAVYLVLAGHPWPGTFIGGADLAAMIGGFLYGTKSRSNERVERLRVLKE